jgi:peptidoglycan hydrolase CwlO-like protein
MVTVSTHRLTTQPEPHSAIHYSLLIYSAVAGFLFVRLILGLGLALKLRKQAVPLDAAVDVRISQQIAAPVTVASTILLPPASTQWEPAKLSIVLKHEQSHVQRADFYILLFAGLHCAIFWFSPFSWWLQKCLSELGEALSDHAALEVAESRTAYAETLLEFASAGQWPLTAVAMARSSSLRSRIERLLSDHLYTEAFSGKRQLPFLAAALVIFSAAASTSLVRAHAAETPAPHQVAEPAAAPPAPPSPVAPPPAEAATGTSTGNGSSYSDGQSSSSTVATNQTTTDEDIDSSSQGFSYASNHNGDAFALVTGNGDSHISFSGSFDNDFQRIRSTTPGDFIYYRHNGKSYVIQDPILVAKAKSLYAPMQELGRRQEALGKQQEALGTQQEALGKRQEQVSISTPDLKKELASLTEATDQLKQLQSQPTIDREALADLQEKIGEIQGRLGELQGAAGEQQGALGEQQGKLGEEQGKLGEEQGRIGEQQGKIAEEAQRQLKPLIDQAIRDGQAKPVN